MSNSPNDPNRPDEQPRYGQNAPTGQPQPAEGGQEPYGRPSQPQWGESAPTYGQPQPGQPGTGPQPPMGHQNPGGQPSSPYGYQAAQPAYNYPGSDNSYQQQPAAVARPKEVEIAFWLLIAAAVLTAVSTILSMIALGSEAQQQQIESVLNQMQQSGQAPMDASAIAGVTAALLAVMALIAIGLYLLIAFMVRKGKNWARITGTVLAVLSLLLLFQPPNLMTLVIVLGVAAIVLLFLPASNAYFNAVKTRKYGGYAG